MTKRMIIAMEVSHEALLFFIVVTILPCLPEENESI
jgi:hypothetical protein